MPRVSADYYENKKKEIIEAMYRVCAKKPVTSVVMKDVIEELPNLSTSCVLTRQSRCSAIRTAL